MEDTDRRSWTVKADPPPAWSTYLGHPEAQRPPDAWAEAPWGGHARALPPAAVGDVVAGLWGDGGSERAFIIVAASGGRRPTMDELVGAVVAFGEGEEPPLMDGVVLQLPAFIVGSMVEAKPEGWNPVPFVQVGTVPGTRAHRRAQLAGILDRAPSGAPDLGGSFGGDA